ncbi:MAG: molybdopterin synthase subunit MoaD [Verrucomicrobiales bacterium]|nr:molybdopterin synthase subunit MoaD [Verrucomicrobiales bacterium]
MDIKVQFFSFFKDLAGHSEICLPYVEGERLENCLERIYAKCPQLLPFRRSALAAVGLDYQAQSHLLQPGDVVSLFPPVQGG